MNNLFRMQLHHNSSATKIKVSFSDCI